MEYHIYIIQYICGKSLVIILQRINMLCAVVRNIFARSGPRSLLSLEYYGHHFRSVDENDFGCRAIHVDAVDFHYGKAKASQELI